MTKGFFSKAFDDMNESAKKQHERDKENFEAIKADSKARFEEAKKQIQTSKNLKMQKV